LFNEAWRWLAQPSPFGAEWLEKLKEAGPIEFAGLQTEYKPPVPQADGAEIPHTLAGGGVQ